jgi:AAA15 family ATPase/GTPase
MILCCKFVDELIRKKMLIDFRFKNFLSYKDENRLLMTKVKSFKEHDKTHIIKTNKGLDLLKTTAIYGGNGGGKSNFIGAMGFMKSVIHNSFSESLKKEEDRGIKDYYFKLSELTDNKPTLFEVSFLKNDSIYRYGFEIKGYEIISEWLFKKNEVETQLFNRENNNFKINNKGFSEGSKHKNDVNSNVLFLSHLAQNNAKESSIIFEWFDDLNVVSGLDDGHYKNVTKEILNESLEFKAWLSLAVRFLEITNIETSKEKDLITYHNKYDMNNVIIGSVAFDFEREESQGTRKLIYLLGAIYDTLMNGKILFIDELDSKLHPNLTKKLLDFFHKLNLRNSQFVFTAHDAILLDKEIFRRDQIWFVDRNKFGASELYAMSEFDASVVRNTSDFRKKYLDCVFGAAETINITNELIDLMHVKK